MSQPEKDKTLERFWDMPLRDLLLLLQATPAGLTSAEAKERLRVHGPNSLVGESRFAALLGLFGVFPNLLVQAPPDGLTSAQAKQRLRVPGPNSLVGESRFAALLGFFGFFANPLVAILLAAGALSIVLRDP